MANTTYQAPGYLQARPRLPAPDYLLDWYLAAKRSWWDDWDQADGERTWRASALGYCLRRQTLERRGIPATGKPDAKTYRTFAWGDMVHDFLRGIFWKLGLVVAEEPTFVDADRQLTGHVDLIWTPNGFPRQQPDYWSDEYAKYITWLRTEFLQMLAGLYGGEPTDTDLGYLGMEIKSAHSKAMTRIIDEGPYEWHRIQAAAYKHMALTTGKVPYTDPPIEGQTFDASLAERWQVVYIGKDSTGILAFEVEDAWVDEALVRLDTLNTHWERGLLPACSCEGWWVKSCSYNEGATCCGRELKGRVSKEIRKHA